MDGAFRREKAFAMRHSDSASRKTLNGSILVGLVLAVEGLFGVPQLGAQDLATLPGKELFQQKCMACHSIGEGRRVGPDLAGINARRTESWLLKFIKSSQALVASGDPDAKTVFEEFKIVMPDQPVTDDEIRQILAYIDQADGGAVTSANAAAKPSVVEPEPTADEIVLGQNLFQGKLRFKSGSPSCISCHNVTNDAIIGGGILAKELTTVYSRMGSAGIQAILSNAPFPVMKAAYETRALEKAEIDALVSFLRHADKENLLHQPREYGWAMFLAGSLGVMLLFGFFSIVGGRRKRRSVNQAIYDRQLQSE